MNAKKSLTGCLLLLGLGLAARAGAQTFALQAAADTSLRESPANQNRGGDATLLLAHDGRALVRFDQSALAATVGSGRLVSASLELFVHSASGWGAAGHPVEAHPLTVPWTEAGATWNCAVDTNPANNKQDCATPWAGGTFDDASDTVLQTKDAGYWLTFDVTADVAAFLTGTPNEGWLIEKSDGDQGGKAEYTSREGAAAERPRLVLLVETAAHDVVPPTLAIASPNQPVLVNEPSPTVVVQYADGGSGVDLATLQVRMDGQDVTARCATGAQSASCPVSGLAAGSHAIAAHVSDRAGNAAQASFAFQLLIGPGPHVVTFQAVGDAYLRNGDANKNFGAEPILRVREGGQNRALVQFDAPSLASALAGATLVSASLELHIEKNGRNWGKQGRPVEAHRATAAWTELGATWNCPNDTNATNNQPDCPTPWAGGSFVATPTASVLHTRDLAGWVTYDVTTDVAAFAAGTPNRGWLLKKADETQSGRVDYDSRQGTPGEAPRLIVVFTTATTADTTPPTLAVTVPGPIVGSSPVIQLSYSDSGSGLALSTLAVRVDGIALTGCAVGPAAASCATSGLAPGVHAVDAAIRDLAGNPASAGATFRIDVAPTLTIVAPNRSLYVDPTIPDPVPAIAVVYSSLSPGLDLGSLRVLFQNVGSGSGPLDLTAECSIGPSGATCPMPIPKDGQFEIDATISDLTGHGASASFPFAVQFSADNAPPVLTVDSPADGAFVRAPLLDVRGSVTDDTGVALVLVNGPMATLTGSSFHAQIPLEAGQNRVQVTAVDGYDKTTEVTRTVILDVNMPTLAFTTPENGKITDQGSIAVAGAVADDSGVATVTVNGSPATLAGGQFSASVPLAEGPNRIEAVVTDLAGNSSAAALQVVRFSPPAVAITSPAQMSLVATPTVEVRGTVDPPVGSVLVNGVPALVSGNAFTAQVPLFEGTNVVAAVAATSSGATGTGTVEVFRDSTAPLMAVAFPADGATVHDSTVPVGGTVQDNTIVAAGPLQVTVNGTAATVAGGGFLLPAVTLAPGANTLEIVATDPAGNSVRQQVAVNYAPLAGEPRIAVVSGDLQAGRIRSTLAAPLVVSLTDASGHGVAAQPVVFRITGDDGSLRDGAKNGRSLAVQTDSAGLATISWTLGDRAGLGKNRVRATSAGFAGEALFTASGQPGIATRLQLDTGNNQTGVVGRQLSRPFVVVATDEALNPVAGVPLSFVVTKGGGGLGGQAAIRAVTGDEGRFAVFLALGPEEGLDNNVVAATLDSAADGAAIFYASGQVAGAPEATTVSGVVLDNVDAPVPGVTLRIPDTALATQTDAAGHFSFGPAPVGDIRLVVDGSTATRPGVWPDLEFDLTTVSGRETTLGRPIYLLPIDLGHGVLIDETHGATLTLADVPGFSLTIAPGSAVFPGGSRSGVVSVTPVHADKVPMVPSLGQQPQFTVTIQPPGIHFDPPAKITLPNVEGFPPGAITQIFSFLHDQGQFEAVGPATVSEDGALVVSDSGFGIVHGGWHYQPPPPPPDPPSNSCHCPKCQTCIVGACGIPGIAPSCDDGKFCTEHDACAAGECTGKMIEDMNTGEISVDLTTEEKVLDTINHIIDIGTTVIPFCEPPKFSGLTGSVKRQSYSRCCENKRAKLPGHKFGGEFGFEIEGGECLVPGFAVSLGAIGKFGAFIGIDGKAGISSSVGRNPCDESEECPTGLSFDFDGEGSVEFKLKGGVELILVERDVLSVTGGVRGGGSLKVELKCGSPKFSGLVIGPAELFISATVFGFIHFSEMREIPNTRYPPL